MKPTFLIVLSTQMRNRSSFSFIPIRVKVLSILTPIFLLHRETDGHFEDMRLFLQSIQTLFFLLLQPVDKNLKSVILERETFKEPVRRIFHALQLVSLAQRMSLYSWVLSHNECQDFLKKVFI